MRIWKFPIPLRLLTTSDPASIPIDMPSFASLLDVQAQGEEIVIWALVDPNAATVERRFCVIETGFTLPEPIGEYLGTVQFFKGTLVLHVFEVTP